MDRFLIQQKTHVINFMKKRILLLLILALNSIAVFAQDAPKTFQVQDGAAPWYDRVNVWMLGDVPPSLAGEVIPQQSCRDRSLKIVGSPASITMAVSEKDLDQFMQAFPNATKTWEKISINSTDGATIMPYFVVRLLNPPQKIQGAQPFAAGLVLLKIEGGEKSQPPTEQASSKEQALDLTDKPASPTLPAFSVPQQKKLHIYVLMGQSNMVGRDTTGLESQTLDERVGFLNASQQWYVAKEPMHEDGSGMGMGIPFAHEMLRRTAGKDCKIGLVPCAVGGTSLKLWEKGGVLYERAVARTKTALAVGELKGILWHQGESDCSKLEDAQSYGQRLVQMLKDLRSDLGAPEVPIVVGQLGEFLILPSVNVKTIQNAIKDMPQQLPHVGYADSQGLKDKGDSLHFTTDSEREFGRRYAQAMEQLQK